jgi:hypothetical protein
MRVLAALAAIGYVGIIALMALVVFGNPTAQDLAEAEVRRDQVLAEQAQGREQCLANADQRPPGVSEEEFCGPEPTPENFPVEDFTDKQTFSLAGELPNGAVGIGSFSAVLAFLVGATFIGAEWSSRSIVALLFWEPRRFKVIGVKLLVTAVMAALFGAVAQLVWAGTAQLLARTRGTTSGLPDNFWGDVFAQQARCTLLVTLMALFGFSIANVIRNTGASLGVGFVYFAILEPILRGIRPSWQPWLLTPNIEALLTKGGARLHIGPGLGQSQETPVREIVLSNLHGALVIGGITAVIVAAGVILFKRRDLH